MVAVTTHAKKRLKERCGVTKNSALKMAERAFNKGISFENASTDLKKYISSVYLCHEKSCNNIRIYGNMVYIFDNQTLITVYPIPEYIVNKMEDTANSIDYAAEKVNKEYTRSKNNSTKNETMPISENKAIEFAREIFWEETFQPYKYSFKNDSAEKYILLSFTTPAVAKNYKHIIKKIAEETGYDVRINGQPNFTLLQKVFLEILSQNGIRMIRPASFNDGVFATIYVACGTQKNVCEQIKKEIFDTYGIYVTFVICGNELHKPICKMLRAEKLQVTYESEIIFYRKAKSIDFSFIKSSIKRYLEDRDVHVLKIGLRNDDIGLYIELAVDEFNKISPDEMQKLANGLGIRIKYR